MCRFDDGDECRTLDQRMVRARRVWECEECRRQIAIGDTYERLAVKSDGTVEVWRACLECAAWRDALFDAQRRECDGETYVFFGGLWSESIPEFCEEHLGYHPRREEE